MAHRISRLGVRRSSLPPSAPGGIVHGLSRTLVGPDVVAVGEDVVTVIEIAVDSGRPHGAPVNTVTEAVPHRVPAAPARPVDHRDLHAAKDRVVPVHAIAVRDDCHMKRIREVVSQKCALRDFQVLQAAPPSRSGRPFQVLGSGIV